VKDRRDARHERMFAQLSRFAADATRGKGVDSARFPATIRHLGTGPGLRNSCFLRPVVLSPLPNPLRSPLLTFALSAIVFSCTCAGPAAAAARQTPTRHAPFLAVPKLTVGERAAAVAVREVGVPYRWGGASPAAGFDCSGLVYWAYGRLGIELPHSSYALYGQGRRVTRARMKAGDLLFFSGLGHVGIYVGRGRMVHAPHSGTRVQVVRLGSSSYGGRIVGVRRVVG
jgi:murein DD-endopeptidase